MLGHRLVKSAVPEAEAFAQRREVLRRLAAVLAVKSTPADDVSAQRSLISTGWDAIDRVLAPNSPCDLDSGALAHVGRGGLRRRAIHEWICGDAAGHSGGWSAPHSVFIHLAWQAIEAEEKPSGLIVWIGRRVWPLPPTLRKSPFQSHASLFESSIFVDPPDVAARVWAIDLALRSQASSVIVADGSKLRMAESRRLQLAAERGRGLALLARPGPEVMELSAATTRWRIRQMPAPSPAIAPHWIVELLRCRHGCALQVSQAHGTSDSDSQVRGCWEMEYVSPGHVCLVADVVDRSGSSGTLAEVAVRRHA